MGAGFGKGKEVVANKQVERGSGSGPIWWRPNVAGDCDDLEETCNGLW